jgi:hypothetical protein
MAVTAGFSDFMPAVEDWEKKLRNSLSLSLSHKILFLCPCLAISYIMLTLFSPSP